jgi:hypothetical protein
MGRNPPLSARDTRIMPIVNDGNKVIKDITKWRDYVHFPEIRSSTGAMRKRRLQASTGKRRWSWYDLPRDV